MKCMMWSSHLTQDPIFAPYNRVWNNLFSSAYLQVKRRKKKGILSSLYISSTPLLKTPKSAKVPYVHKIPIIVIAVRDHRPPLKKPTFL